MLPVVDTLENHGFAGVLRAPAFTLWRGDGGNPLAGALDWERLREQILEGGVSPGSLRVMVQRTAIAQAFYADAGGIKRANFEALLARGVSLVFNAMEDEVPAMTDLRARIRERFGRTVSVGAVVSLGAGGAFKLHCDASDVLIVHLEGRKHWTVYGPSGAAPGTVAEEGYAPQQAPVFDDALGPGDMLYIPSDHLHRCENGPGTSFHLSIAFKPAG